MVVDYRGFKCKLCHEFVGAVATDNPEVLKVEHIKTHSAADLFYLEAL